MGRAKVPLGISPITSLERPQLRRWVRSGFKPRCGPSIENFELFLDFEEGSTKLRGQGNAWNETAAHLFAEDFIATFPEYAEEQDLVISNFLTHLITLKKHYVRYMKDDLEDEVENLRDKACRQRRMNVRLSTSVYVRQSLNLISYYSSACCPSPEYLQVLRQGSHDAIVPPTFRDKASLGSLQRRRV